MTRRVPGYLSVFGPFLGLILIYLFFALCDLAKDGPFDDFGTLFSAYNLKTVAAQTTIVAVAALGMTIIIISAGIDLSPGSSIALTTVVVALCLDREGAGGEGIAAAAPIVAVLAGVATGAVVGFLNGAMITGLRIVPFIVTLGMMGIARGVAKLLAGEQKVNAPTSWLEELLSVDPRLGVSISEHMLVSLTALSALSLVLVCSRIKDARWRGALIAVWVLLMLRFWLPPWGVIVLIGLAFLVFAILRFSVFGRYIFAIGSNEAAARLCGIRVGLQKVLIYTMAGALTGVAGVLQFGQLTVGDPTVAVGKELDIIASVVIGGGSLSGGKGSVAGTLIGAFIMGILRNGCDIYGIPNYVQEIFIGIIIVAAVGVDRLRSRGEGLP